MNNNLRFLLIGIGGILAVGFLLRRQAAAAIGAVADVNEGTPFEGTGVIGTAGNIANVASGGILADIGSGIGLFFSNIFDTRTIDDITGT